MNNYDPYNIHKKAPIAFKGKASQFPFFGQLAHHYQYSLTRCSTAGSGHVLGYIVRLHNPTILASTLDGKSGEYSWSLLYEEIP